MNCVLCTAQCGRDKGKPRGTKREIAAYKKRMRTVSAAVTLLVIVCVTIVVSFYYAGLFAGPELRTDSAGRSLGGSVNDNSGRNSRKVALIDALFNASEDGDFAGSLNKTLREVGFGVDVFQGSEVTVDFLETFAGGYKAVILRMHSALSFNKELYLFTAEPFSSGKYSQEQYFRFVKEAYATESSQPVFAVNWGFVRRLMPGKFNGTLVVVMGCDGACDPFISQEFIDQGAVGYAGWSGPVLLSHSDKATLHLIEDLYVGKQSLKEAVNDTNNKIGRDPASGSILECYAP